MRRPLLLLILMAIAFSCETEQINQLGTEEPDYMAKGQIASMSFLFEAGNADYYMFPRIAENPYANGQMAEAILSPTCGSEFCPNSLRLRYFVDSPGQVDIQVGQQPLLKLDPDFQKEEFSLNLFAIPPGNPGNYTYEWLVDSVEYQGAAIRDTVEGSDHFICLTISSGGLSIGQKCRTISLLDEYSCDVALNVGSATNDPTAMAVASGEPPFTIHWNYPGVDDAFALDMEGRYFVCATNVDAGGCVALICTEMIHNGQDVIYNDIDFEVQGSEIPPAIIDYNQNWEVIYTDENGKSFSSARKGNQCSCIDIIASYSQYSEVERQDVLVIEFEFTGSLIADDDSEIELNNAVGKMAFPASW